MPDLKLTPAKAVDVKRVTDELGATMALNIFNETAADLTNKVQCALSELEWTDELDNRDWLALQDWVLQQLAGR